jgi:anti-sigma factor RsiW
MNCMQVGRRLQRYLDDDLDDLTARRIMRHLEDCRRCGMEATAYTEIKASLARRGTDIPDAAVTRLRAFGERLVHDGLPADRDLPDETPGA